MWTKKCKLCNSSFKAVYPAEFLCSYDCKKEARRMKNKRYIEKLKLKPNIVLTNSEWKREHICADIDIKDGKMEIKKRWYEENF